MEKIRINGSICLSDISEKYKQGHSAITKAANGKVYANVVIWVNDCNDDFKDASIQLNSVKDKQESEGKVYVGNGKIKPTTATTAAPTPQASTKIDESENLPF